MKPEELRKFRLAIDISQDEMAEKLDVTKQYISYLETGKKKISDKFEKKLYEKFNYVKPPTLEEIEKVADHIDSELGYFLSEEEENILGEMLAEQKDLLFMLIRKLKKEPGKVKRFLLED